ncbi:MAG TPA: tRNA (adenosine(37)-N6)-dimethylallyltransferase MiaA [Chloroflexia bacterium]|nr:tRNA (adenosine(37)-N6)-dimethylallyltransferase MiaA [Chloroflexia bacterium]
MLAPLLVITGPTAVGKSALALSLAQKLNGEIVAADSRTLYRGMDIATAKPAPEELLQVRHHLIDIINPDEEFALPDFLEQAQAVISDIHSRGKLPMLVGGTVQYINALVEGWQVPRVPPRRGLREQLEQEAAERGSEALYRDLQVLDPEAAEHINPLNTRRIVRALEVYHTTGQLFSQSQGKNPPPYRILKIGLTLEREKLYARADHRIEVMFEQGLVDEVRRLLAEGYAPTLPAMSSVGYQQVIAYLNGEMTLEEAQERMRFTTHRYIRQQYTWFRRDPAIHWLQANEPELEQKALALVREYLV